MADIANASCRLSTQEERIDSVGLLSWGANSYGQLAQGHKEDQVTPGKAGQSSVACTPHTVTGGGGHTLVIAEEDSLWACGSNSHGQLGLGNKDDVEVLTLVCFPTPVKISQVCGGWDFSLACTVDGVLYAWGSNTFHQIGITTGEKYLPVPRKVDVPNNSSVVYLAAGLRHGLALTADGVVYGWGQNKKNQVGYVTDPSGTMLKAVSQPTSLNISPRDKIVCIFAGAYHSGALTDSHDIYLWGCNKFGQLSQDPGTTPQLAHPCCVSNSAFGSQKIRSAVSGWTHNLVLTVFSHSRGSNNSCLDSGQVYSWGRGDYGQLGRSCDKSCDPTPKPVSSIQGVCSVVCGSEHNLCLTGEGKLFCWGWNEHGICGTGDETNVPLPAEVALAVKPVVSVGCGAGHSFAIVKR